MRIAIAAEADPTEPRVAATPETVKKFKALGAEVVVARGAGLASGILDADYEAAGATVGDNVSKDADVVLKVRRPAPSELAGYKKGALVVAIMDPYGNDAALKQMADAGVTAFALELIPRITRAQSMDILTSQANLAGYKAVLLAANNYGRIFPQMMTPAGTLRAVARLHHGRGRGRPAGDRHGAPAGRDRDGDRRAARDQGAGRVARRASSSPSRTRSSRRPRPRAATPRR